ncbi:GAG-pre-integrase domain-containing protein, partial [Klebsiella pneumoniae]|uniref:GAG-pre-integrase domain-containing protein n=1 Tax=Klebsiella pneumoniae TaxID=573 RepID=UPI0024DEE9EE
MIIDKSSNELKLVVYRESNVYIMDLNVVMSNNVCLTANDTGLPWLWHRRLGHASFGVLTKSSKHDLIVELPKLSDLADKGCEACGSGKQSG